MARPAAGGAPHRTGPRQAGAPDDYGTHAVGVLAAVPTAAVQRRPDGKAVQLVADHARGNDPRPFVPPDLPRAASVRHGFAFNRSRSPLACRLTKPSLSPAVWNVTMPACSAHFPPCSRPTAR
ncbi:hypothetical protein [Streptomyces sp. NPDC018610]|uniref:hypothetical protein n=1 Tax=Streptomyces sp. NPDC018610 TaxID=3365049 RepID=UPI0037A417AE